MGNYKGGEVVVYSEKRDKMVTLSTRNNPVIFDGRLVYKVNRVTDGPRFHLIVYKQKDESSLTQSPFPLYDVAHFHPDSKPVNVINRDGCYVSKSRGLQEIHDNVKEFLFDSRTSAMKLHLNDKLVNSWLYQEREQLQGLDENRYILSNVNLPPDLVSTVTQNFIHVLNEMNPTTFTNMHSYGFLLKTVGCKRQPIHIDGEHNNFFAIIPILQSYVDTYDMFVMKVRHFVAFFYENKSYS